MSARPGEQQAEEPEDATPAEVAGAEVVRLPLGDALEAVAPARVTIGQRLRQAREAAGLSLADVADRTKVRPGLLTQIEADAHERLPALTYTLGFIKAYARTVGLDPGQAAEQFRLEAGSNDPPPSLIDLQPLEERRLPSRALVVTSLAATLIAVAVLAAFSFRPAPAPVVGEGAAPAPAAIPAELVAASDPAPVAPPSVALVAREDVWIRVTDATSGERFFEGALAAGGRLDIPPERKLVLRAGRAGALEVSIGGEVLPPLGGAGEVLRAQPLDAEALRAATASRAGLADAPAPLPG